MVNIIIEEKGRNTEEGDCEVDFLEVTVDVFVFVVRSFFVGDFF